jgi:hypothetical protein
VRRRARAIRDVLHQCLLCGSVSRALSTVVGYPNPEEAYLLGLFANWGQLCFAAYYPERYERPYDAARARDARARARDEFGLGSASSRRPCWRAGTSRRAMPTTFGSRTRRAASVADDHGQRLFALVDVANEYAAHAIDPDPEVASRGRSDPALGRDHVRRRLEDCEGRRRTRCRGGARAHAGVAHGGDETGADAGGDARDGGDRRERRGFRQPIRSSMTSGTSLGTSLHRRRWRHSRSSRRSRAPCFAQENINDTLAMVLEGIARTGGFDAAFLALLNARKDRLVGPSRLTARASPSF